MGLVEPITKKVILIKVQGNFEKLAVDSHMVRTGFFFLSERPVFWGESFPNSLEKHFHHDLTTKVKFDRCV